jgi:hypothetical protein
MPFGAELTFDALLEQAVSAGEMSTVRPKMKGSTLYA